MDTPIPSYKCVIVGDTGIGKTAFVIKHITGEFIQIYEPTLGVEVHPHVFNTSHGLFRFNIWDTAGQEKYRGLGDGYYVQADCAIVMFDLTSKLSYISSKEYYNAVRNKCPSIPIIIVGMKADISDEQWKVSPDEIEFNHDTDAYYNVSAKSNYNIEKPS